MADQYTLIHTFADITDTVVAPQATKQYQDVNPSISANTVTSATASGQYGREITDLEVSPPYDAGGAAEDLREVWFDLDNHSMQHYVNFSGTAQSLMFPRHDRIWGGRGAAISLGMPLWRAIAAGVANMPLLCTALRYTQHLQPNVHTIAGLTGAGSNGWRLALKGYQYQDAELADLNKGWKNAVSLQTETRRLVGLKRLQFTFTPAGPLSVATFTSYPGGPDQGGIKVNPYWHMAFNNVNTQPNKSFVLSNHGDVAGGSNNVEDSFQDLAILKTSGSALWLRGIGIAPGAFTGTGAPVTSPLLNLAGFDFYVDGDYVPELTGGEGFIATAGWNDYAYGETGAAGLPVSGFYLPMPRLLGELLIYDQNWAPALVPGGAPIPADAVVLAINGILVEGV